MKLVALAGPSGCGKTTLSQVFPAPVYVRFAQPIKDMLAVLTDRTGKLEPNDDLCGRTFRYAAETLGTEWGRQMIGPDLWVRHWRRRMHEVAARRPEWVVVDDVRFDGEAQAVRAMGGVVVRVVRPGHVPDTNHVSNKLELSCYDAVLVNDEPLDAAQRRLFKLVDALL